MTTAGFQWARSISINTGLRGSSMHPVPGWTHVLVTDSSKRMMVVDLATGVKSTPYAGPGGNGVIIRGVAPDAEYAVLQDVANGAILAIMDARAPITSTGQVRILRTENRPSMAAGGVVRPLPNNRMLAGGYHLQPLELVTDVRGAGVTEFVDCYTGYRIWANKWHPWHARIDHAAATKEHKGVLLLSNPYSVYHLLKIDVDTMTFASMAPPSVQPYGKFGGISGTNPF